MQDFNQAIAVNPNDAAAYLGRGNLVRSQNDFDAALADLNQAIRLNPEGAQAYHARGLIYQRQGNNARRSPTSTTPSTAIPSPARLIRRADKAMLATG